jgi:hypothetical protein
MFMKKKKSPKEPSTKSYSENALPHSLRIGPFIYAVRQTRGFAAFRSVWGEARPAELMIEIENDIDAGQKWQILFHEFLHVADEIYHLQLPEENKDDIIDRLATCIYAMLHDNSLLKE